MEFKWLRDFATIARTRNFTRSAQERHVTQPAFSRRIRALESWLDVKLIDRSTYPVELTREGIVFAEVAKEIINKLDATRVALRADSNQRRNLVKFAAAHTIALYFFPNWLERMEDHFGSIRTSMSAENFGEGIDTLMAGQCDFLMCFAHPQVSNFLDSQHCQFLIIGTDNLIPVSMPVRDHEPKYCLGQDVDTPLP